MRRVLTTALLLVLTIGMMTLPSIGRDKPNFSLLPVKWLPAPEQFDLNMPGMSGAGGQFSKVQIERFRCTASGNPAAGVILNCATPEFNQDFGPDNEIAVAVNPANANHIVVGSNDYYYRFNNSTGARQATVPTGFFTSFDGGATWIDGQIPMLSGNGAGSWGGGIWSGVTTVWITNSILADNTGTDPWNGYNTNRTLQDGGGNLQWPTTHPNLSPDTPVAAGVLFADPQLQAIASNGGFTQTMGLPMGSPALDLGIDANAAAWDQRGLPRNGRSDAGAFERQ